MTQSLVSRVTLLAQEESAPSLGQNLTDLAGSATAIFGAMTIMLAIGMWLMLPRGTDRGRRTGMILALIGLGLLGSRLPGLATVLEESVFAVLAIVTVAACAATVSTRNPLYSAVWFGMALLGTAGLFLVQGAQFLGVATVVVYAGAILVTFLFALMLAQPGGHAYYDRISWEASFSAATGAVMVGMLAVTIGNAAETLPVEDSPQAAIAADETLRNGVLSDQHVARLGGQLFSRHLVTVEVAAALLLAALVGAMAIVTQGTRHEPPDKSTGTSPGPDAPLPAAENPANRRSHTGDGGKERARHG
ncbi:MAG: NADH-quinone oxidoreductase subunit J [Pirellulales bacterium]